MDKGKIILAGALWGLVGVFAQMLFSAGLSSGEVAGLRFIFATLILSVLLFVKDKKLFKPKRIFFSALIGISNFATCLCYYNSIKYSGGGIACVLLFTSPIVVVVVTALLYKKIPSKVTVLGIALSVLGLMLAGNVFSEKLSVKGFTFGILSAITNAMVTIVGAKAVKGASSLTVNFYGFLFSAILGLIFIKSDTISIIGQNTSIISILITLAGVCTVLPYTLYISALKNYSEQKASLLCSSEPITANIIECIIYAQKPTLSLIIGLVGIIIAVWLVGVKNKKEGEKIDKQILQGSIDRIR